MSQIAQISNNATSTSFVIKTQLQMHGLGLNVKALCDTGADISLLVSPSIARQAVERLGAKMSKCKHSLRLADYRQREAGLITHTLKASFEIDGRKFKDQTFYVTESGHDVFVGQKWLAEQDVWLHPKTKSFAWPDSTPANAKFSRTLTLPRDSKQTIDPAHQKDASRRDRLMDQAIRKEKRIRILQRPWTTQHRTTNEPKMTDVAALEAQIKADPRLPRWQHSKMPRKAIWLDEKNDYPTISLSALTSAPWKTHKGKSIPFPPNEDKEHIDLVRAKLPSRLKHLEGFFSKKASQELPPYRPGFDVELELERPTTGSPPKYRTPFEFLPLEKETIDELLRIGFIEPCMEENAAPVLFADKPHSTEKRFCVDYRWINQFLKGRLVPAPDVHGTRFNCRNAKRWSKIDIIRAFNRLRMALGSEWLTAFRTRQGTFRWRVLPFGLKVGPAWWQALINAQLNELLDLFASAYADDVLIWTETEDEEEHFDKVEEVIHRLHKVDLQGDIKKSRFFVDVVDYLGMMMEAGKGTRIDPEKIAAIKNWNVKDLTSKSAIRSFLGLCNYVRMFCHHASGAAEPLNRLLKKDATFTIGPEQVKAFEQLKQLATEAPVLAFFQPGAPTKVETDASRNATGGVIWQQQSNKEWKPVGYFSKTMTPAERAYPIQDRELLAVVQTLESYAPELMGQKFTVVTDHQALLYFANKRLLSTRQVRWADFLSNFDITFQYRPGRENVAADALSRKTAENPTVKAREKEERTMALIPQEQILEQPLIGQTTRIPDMPQGADLVDLIKKENELQQLGFHDEKLIVPETTRDGRIFLRTALIREAHEPKIFAHAGQNKTIQLLRGVYYWDGLSKTVRQYIKNCHECEQNKTRHDKTPGLLRPLPIPNHVWEHVVVDGKDMPTDQFRYNYVWVFVCKFSRIIFTIPGKKTDTAEVLAQRYYRYIYRLLGVPLVWISDNAGPFVSKFMQTINELTGTKHRHGSSLHPQTQGAVEITNQDLDQRLRFYVDKYQTRWSIHLPALDFAHNASWHSSIGMSPLKVMLGTEPRNPLSLPLPQKSFDEAQGQTAAQILEQTKRVQDEARVNAAAAQGHQEKQANKKRREVNFTVGDSVFVKKKGFTTPAPTTRLDSQWAGPWEIKEERGHSFVLDVPTTFKGKNLFHADRLRKADLNPLPQQRQEPPAPEEINGEPEWEVEKVLASRVKGRAKRLEYQVSWTGCDPDEEWYPAGNLKNAASKLAEFHEQYPSAAGPPIHLMKWLTAAAEDRTKNDLDDDNVAVHGDLSQGQRKHPRQHA